MIACGYGKGCTLEDFDGYCALIHDRLYRGCKLGKIICAGCHAQLDELGADCVSVCRYAAYLG